MIWGGSLRAIVMGHVKFVLDMIADGNKKEAAQYMGISVRTLRDWVRNYPELRSHYKGKRHDVRKEGKDQG